MNRRFLKLTCVLGGLMGLASAGYGQSTVSKVHVPFDFIAGGKSLPAGITPLAPWLYRECC